MTVILNSRYNLRLIQFRFRSTIRQTTPLGANEFVFRPWTIRQNEPFLDVFSTNVSFGLDSRFSTSDSHIAIAADVKQSGC